MHEIECKMVRGGEGAPDSESAKGCNKVLKEPKGVRVRARKCAHDEPKRVRARESERASTSARVRAR